MRQNDHFPHSGTLIAVAATALSFVPALAANGQDLSGLTSSTASIYEGKRYRCRSDIIQTRPRVEMIMQCESFVGFEYSQAFAVFCLLDKQGYEQYRKDNPDDDKQRMLYTCPVRTPIPFRNGEGVDLNCEFLSGKEIREWHANRALSGQRSDGAKEPESWCTAKKFEIDWEAHYEDWESE